MNYKIERIKEDNYSRFDAMLFWREHGSECKPLSYSVDLAVKEELKNPNLYVYAIEDEGRYVGWISLVYIPKVSKWKGHGHIYVDELWVAPSYRKRGLAKALMKKADELKEELEAVGIRLYVNVNNPEAIKLYESCAYEQEGQAFFMEK